MVVKQESTRARDRPETQNPKQKERKMNTTANTAWKRALKTLEAAGHRPAPATEELLRRYLDDRNSYTIGTFLHHSLRGKAKVYAQRYYHCLTTRLTTLVQAGVVKEVPSVRGGAAYVYG
jgi:hypothetical protein